MTRKLGNAEIDDLVVNGSASIDNLRNPNLMINGSLDFWQRGIDFPAQTGYTADRIGSNGNLTHVSRITDPPTGFTYGLRHKFDTSGGGAFNNLFSFLESKDTRPLHGKYVTVSMWMRKGSNLVGSYSVKLGKHTVEAANGGEGTFGSTDVTSSLTTSWQRFSFTTNSVIDTGSEVFGWSCRYDSSVIDANNYVDIAGVKIEEGQAATGWNRNGAITAVEFANCQRFYSKSWHQDTLVGNVTTVNAEFTRSPTVGLWRDTVHFPVVMRRTPTWTAYAANSGTQGSWTNYSGGATDVTVNTTAGGDRLIIAEFTSTGSETYVGGHWTADAEI